MNINSATTLLNIPARLTVPFEHTVCNQHILHRMVPADWRAAMKAQLKAFTQTRLNFMDRIQVPCDGRLNYDPTGTMTDHFVIPGGKQGAGLYTVRFLIPA